MANITDYVAWRGDLDMSQSPWNDVDALLMATLCYLDFEGTNSSRGITLAEAKAQNRLRATAHSLFGARREMFEAMADSVRFRDVRMHHYIANTDMERRMQFSAVCCDLPDGTLCVAFRGTDATLIGWREDLDMSLLEPVPAQEAAAFYLERAAGMDGRGIRVLGHSKGGNLAAYAAAKAKPALQDRFLEIDSFDGPGMAPDVFESEGYRRIEDRIHSVVPQTSIVGMMMCYHRRYTVVRADAAGMAQHNSLTWRVRGPGFETLADIDESARVISETLHEFLEKSDRNERAAFLDAAFEMIESTGATTLGEIKEDKLKSLWIAMNSGRDLNPEARKEFNKVVGLFLSLGVGNVVERYRSRRSEKAAEKAEKAEKTEAKALPEGEERKEELPEKKEGLAPGEEEGGAPGEEGD